MDLSEIERAVHEMGIPSIGPEEGRFIYLLGKACGARRILELGTGVGYSTAWLAKSVGKYGEVITIEYDRMRAQTALRLLREAGITWVKVLVGDALQLLKDVDSSFDLIFVDILRGLDEEDGLRLAKSLVSKLRRSGLIVADNAEAPVPGARSFVNYISGHDKFESIVVPYREGVLVALKLAVKD